MSSPGAVLHAGLPTRAPVLCSPSRAIKTADSCGECESLRTTIDETSISTQSIYEVMFLSGEP